MSFQHNTSIIGKLFTAYTLEILQHASVVSGVQNAICYLVRGFYLARLHPKNSYMMISTVLIIEGYGNYAGIIVSTMQGACSSFASIL